MNVDIHFTVLRLMVGDQVDNPLSEQGAKAIGQSAFMLLDSTGFFMNSIQIGELVSLATDFNEKWKDRPHRIAIINAAPEAKRAWDTANLDKLMPLFHDYESAVKFLVEG